MSTQQPVHRFGRVALIGRPNVGKSTLMNTLVGTKLSIVTPKPQTTRHRILGVASRAGAQIAFIDTPGLHQGGKFALNRQLNRVARQVPDEADVLVHVIDGARWRDEDQDVWKLVSDVSARGVKHVTGNIVIDDSYFDDVRIGPAFEQKDEDYAFRAPNGAMSLNYNACTIHVSKR